MVNPYRNLLPSTVGFDRLLSTFDELNEVIETKKQTTYPPYNIFKIDDMHYKIELAVAGFKSDEIDITVEGNKLKVVGQKVPQESEQFEYLHKGIATRDFELNFTLAETILIGSAEFVNGILEIALKNVIPEEKLPRKIKITQPKLLSS
jgi:molecular chaperone IbpA